MIYYRNPTSTSYQVQFHIVLIIRLNVTQKKDGKQRITNMKPWGTILDAILNCMPF